ncbi:MAG: ribbon-helix-helix domain-containing protein [Gemmataceae bacterium]
MSQPQSQKKAKPPQPDSTDVVTLFVDEPEDTSVDPFPPQVRERLKREVVDSYAVDRDKIAKVKQLAIHLGVMKADLIGEGLDLVLEKYRDQLDELLAAQAPGETPKPEKGSPSA